MLCRVFCMNLILNARFRKMQDDDQHMLSLCYECDYDCYDCCYMYISDRYGVRACGRGCNPRHQNASVGFEWGIFCSFPLSINSRAKASAILFCSVFPTEPQATKSGSMSYPRPRTLNPKPNKQIDGQEDRNFTREAP